jgi:cystathionine beta-lyase
VDPALFFLERARVAVNEGTPFGRGFERFVRLNLATSRPILERIVTAMGTALADWRSG